MKKSVLILIAVFMIGIAAVGKYANSIHYAISDNSVVSAVTVILDAGHGGEDGGAVATDGTLEKDVNLLISNGVAAYFELFGISYIPVRTDDRSVCDDGLVTIRERKRSDIRNRYALVNDTENAILLSIHQNYFTQEKYSGAQVFYAPNDDISKTLADCLRSSICNLQPENRREIKPSTDSIFLLYHAQKPSVMVECGFLSNNNERELLKEHLYESKMSYCIFKGMLNYLNR